MSHRIYGMLEEFFWLQNWPFSLHLCDPKRFRLAAKLAFLTAFMRRQTIPSGCKIGFSHRIYATPDDSVWLQNAISPKNVILPADNHS
ncbi:hypothetical protein FPY71_04985 [Aureimonas fodinaquatilis]|uniref:Uncharacterized protein n=1 Tax=Aureimonas fodinaquatilis TaxID=2565783 RepID=A0A5B0E1C9_9HYPH|nr:hypothetical protein [Aureimonas fodinaquatilis]KAA0972448.1 hypothetical protein FPY71_04985 [Aureimonas fodinaquatilis]